MEQILIIEDDFSLNQGLCRALKQEKRQLIPCPNLKTAREQLLCSDPSLVLLDINLPDGSGLDFLREIKTSSPLRPVILLAANDTDMDIVNGLEQGADDYITKPFSLSVLRARVNTQLRKKDSRADSIFGRGSMPSCGGRSRSRIPFSRTGSPLTLNGCNFGPMAPL